MKCKHMHKDDPDNAVCKDCYNRGFIEGAAEVTKKILEKMKGGKNDKTNE